LILTRIESVKAVRDRAHLFLSPEVASHAGITLAELQQFVAGACGVLGGGCVTLTDDQLLRLARRIGCCDE
jgi:hypothetical protein